MTGNSQSASVSSVVVIGGSIAGLFTGLCLLRKGWDVQVFESADKLDGRGAGITTQPGVFDALESIGISPPDNFGLRIHQRKTFATDGSELGSHNHSQTVTTWGRLYRVLRDAFPDDRYHTGCTFTHCEQNVQSEYVQSVDAFFSDGRRVNGSVLVAADGIRSAVRQQLQSSVQPEYAGYVAWRGMVTEETCQSAGMAGVLPYFTFCLPPGEQSLAYPVMSDGFTNNNGSVEFNNRLYNLVWYRAASVDGGLDYLLTDIDGRNNGSSIAPNRIRPEVIADMKSASKSRLAPQHALLIEKIKKPFIQPIYDVLSRTMVCGRVAFVGDAAFTARPHLGMGVTKAAEDACALAECLARESEVEAGLSRFAQERLPVGELTVKRSRQLGAYLQTEYKNDEERHSAEKHRSPSAVMRETATDEYLQEYYRVLAAAR